MHWLMYAIVVFAAFVIVDEVMQNQINILTIMVTVAVIAILKIFLF